MQSGATVYVPAIKKGPVANLQSLHQHNRQQLLPASNTSLAWGVTGVPLYRSHTAMFTMDPTRLCQLPECRGNKSHHLEKRQRLRQRYMGHTEDGSEEKHVQNHQRKAQRWRTRLCERIVCFILKFQGVRSFKWKSSFCESRSFRTGM